MKILLIDVRYVGPKRYRVMYSSVEWRVWSKQSEILGSQFCITIWT